ncbi:hypothetical protein PISMIDRAFT_88296, partial [Pisolithus microcarpus 441]
GIDVMPEHGYCVIQSSQIMHILYPDSRQGRSFHHGRFVMVLRGHAKQVLGADVIKATVNKLIECQHTKRVLGIRATQLNSTERESFLADLVIIVDRCFSNFRNAVMGKALRESSTRSHFCGVIPKDTQLPMPQHGTVGLVQGHGSVLLYQILEHDTCMLVAIKHPVPHDLKGHILRDVVPQLPALLHVAIHEALDRDCIRRMPNSFLPAVEQGSKYTKQGTILLSDVWNMHHPLTGGGMTITLHDIVILSKLLANVNFCNWDQMSNLLSNWYWSRKPLSSTINILSFALYDLFGADSEHLAVLQKGCFKYFECSGKCVHGPVSLLAGISPSPSLLAYHFFAVTFYSIWVMFFHLRPVVNESDSDKPLMVSPQLWEYPGLAVRGMKVLWTACVMFGPLLWLEIHWW